MPTLPIVILCTIPFGQSIFIGDQWWFDLFVNFVSCMKSFFLFLRSNIVFSTQWCSGNKSTDTPEYKLICHNVSKGDGALSFLAENIFSSKLKSPHLNGRTRQSGWVSSRRVCRQQGYPISFEISIIPTHLNVQHLTQICSAWNLALDFNFRWSEFSNNSQSVSRKYVENNKSFLFLLVKAYFTMTNVSSIQNK